MNTVFSLLTDEEEPHLNIVREEAEAKAHSMKFLSYPIPDRQVPDSEANLGKALQKLEAELAAGSNVVRALQAGDSAPGL